MSNELVLRNVTNDDLPIFFEYQLDQEANYMAAFTAKGPTTKPLWHIGIGFWQMRQLSYRQSSSIGMLQEVFRVTKMKASQKSLIGWKGILAQRHCHLGAYRVFNTPQQDSSDLCTRCER